jgi:hypothetical protein
MRLTASAAIGALLSHARSKNLRRACAQHADVAELLAFPNDRFDDQHDCRGLLGMLLDEIVPPVRRAPPKPKVRDGYDEMPDHIQRLFILAVR